MPLAFIHWITEGPQPQPPQLPDGIWGAGGGFPTNPIQLPPWAGGPQPPTGGGGQPPQLPDGIWGAGGGFPTNPIQLPPWAGGWQPRPDQGLPPFPNHPIVLPKPPTPPTEGGEVDPDYDIDEDTGILRPSHPINLPPSPSDGSSFWLLVFIPGHGWEWIAFKPGAPKPPSTAVPK